jgi:hypothetical protein
MAADVEVALPAIGAQLGTAGDVVEHEGGQRRLGDVGDAPHAHAPGRLTAILDGDRHDRLAGDATARSAGPARAEVALVHLDRAGEELAAWDHHRAAELVKPRPRRLVAAKAQHALQPERRDAFFWLTTYQIAANQLTSGVRVPGEDRARRD